MQSRRPEAEWNGQHRPDDLSLVEQITALAEAMTRTSVTELEYATGEVTISLRRRPLANAAPHPVSVPATPAAAPIAPADMTIGVMAPLTGIFYTSSSPAAPVYVQVGEVVRPGQVVCIVEAMKVFNEIKTEIGGIVVAIPPKNNQLVKKGDPLVLIKPA